VTAASGKRDLPTLERSSRRLSVFVTVCAGNQAYEQRKDAAELYSVGDGDGWLLFARGREAKGRLHHEPQRSRSELAVQNKGELPVTGKSGLGLLC
jgi:hypothetical protein